MHELSIMQSALNQALREARRAGAARVHQIRLRIGVLSGVVPDALQFAFEALTPGTAAEGAAADDRGGAGAILVRRRAAGSLSPPISIPSAPIAASPAANFAPAGKWN